MMELMESSNWQLFHRSYREVLEDYDVMKARLTKAHVEHDTDSVHLFDDLYARSYLLSYKYVLCR